MARALFSVVPSRSPLLYKVANLYVDRFNGDNNSDFASNGEARFLREILPSLNSEAGVVFDVGANVGHWAQCCLAIAPKLNMHLFEPAAAPYKTLELIEWPPAVRLNNVGLGSQRETLALNVVRGQSSLNSIYSRTTAVDSLVREVESVTLTTLDDYCGAHGIERIDFLKIDVEGHEWAVLTGARALLQERRIRLIQFEYGGCYLDARVQLADVWALLAGYGFSIGKLIPSGVRRYERYEQPLETFKYSNWVAFSA